MSDEHKASALSPNTVLSSGKQTYRIEKILGAGSFGITYLATTQIMFGNISHKIKVAIKEHFMDSCYRGDDGMQVLCTPTSKTEVEQSRADFLAEAKRLQKICQKSKYIVNVNETFVANGTAYYVMEYLDGGKPGKMSETEAIDFIVKLAEALQVMHKNRLLHLDIKPENIVMKADANGELYPVLIDFGISKHFDSSGNPTSRPKAKGASSGYSPVEQYDEIKEFSPKYDIYALGAVLFYLVTGKNPPDAFKVLNNPGIINNLLPSGLSDTICKTINNAMAPIHSQRTVDATAFIKDLTEHIDEESKEELRDNTTLSAQTSILYKDENEEPISRRIKTKFQKLVVQAKRYINKKPILYLAALWGNMVALACTFIVLLYVLRNDPNVSTYMILIFGSAVILTLWLSLYRSIPLSKRIKSILLIISYMCFLPLLFYGCFYPSESPVPSIYGLLFFVIGVLCVTYLINMFKNSKWQKIFSLWLMTLSFFVLLIINVAVMYGI